MTAVSMGLPGILLITGEALWFAHHESFMRAIRARDSAIAKGGYGTALFGGLGMILTIVSSLVLSEKLVSALNLKNWLSVGASGWVSAMSDIVFAAVVVGAGIMLVKLTGLERAFRRREAGHHDQYESQGQ